MHPNARKVGSDIELFGSPATIPSVEWWSNWIGTLGGIPDKGARLDLGNGYWTHRDGVSAEYGFEPTTSLDQFMTSIHDGKRLVEQVLEHELHPVLDFNVSAIIEEPWAEQVLEMGCQPDFVATERLRMIRRNVPPDVRRQAVRECGGHIHISLPPPYVNNAELCCQFIRELDSVVYPLAATERSMGTGSWYRRRYIFRPTPYGVEYRTLGADALFAPNAEMFLGLVFDMATSVWEV
jgi:hypothetical protein